MGTMLSNHEDEDDHLSYIISVFKKWKRITTKARLTNATVIMMMVINNDR
jgi:hypothetical protein